MRFDFRDGDLCRLYTDPGYHMPRFGTDVTRAYRKKMGLIRQVQNTQELRNYKSLRLEHLSGDRTGQHSIRLNDQWRLIFINNRDADGEKLHIIEITDYH